MAMQYHFDVEVCVAMHDFFMSKCVLKQKKKLSKDCHVFSECVKNRQLGSVFLSNDEMRTCILLSLPALTQQV